MSSKPARRRACKCKGTKPEHIPDEDLLYPCRYFLGLACGLDRMYPNFCVRVFGGSRLPECPEVSR